jgi:hypothetical protein
LAFVVARAVREALHERGPLACEASERLSEREVIIRTR